MYEHTAEPVVPMEAVDPPDASEAGRPLLGSSEASEEEPPPPPPSALPLLGPRPGRSSVVESSTVLEHHWLSSIDRRLAVDRDDSRASVELASRQLQPRRPSDSTVTPDGSRSASGISSSPTLRPPARAWSVEDHHRAAAVAAEAAAAARLPAAGLEEPLLSRGGAIN